MRCFTSTLPRTMAQTTRIPTSPIVAGPATLGRWGRRAGGDRDTGPTAPAPSRWIVRRHRAAVHRGYPATTCRRPVGAGPRPRAAVARPDATLERGRIRSRHGARESDPDVAEALARRASVRRRKQSSEPVAWVPAFGRERSQGPPARGACNRRKPVSAAGRAPDVQSVSPCGVRRPGLGGSK